MGLSFYERRSYFYSQIVMYYIFPIDFHIIHITIEVMLEGEFNMKIFISGSRMLDGDIPETV